MHIVKNSHHDNLEWLNSYHSKCTLNQAICNFIKEVFNCELIYLCAFAGVATAFASKDILGNVLSGLSVQMSQPFSVGDTIRVCFM